MNMVVILLFVAHEKS